MFAKTYKLKSNNTLKNTEKKHLARRIQDEFPQATEEKVKEIVSVKSTCICMKLVLHSGELVNVYAVDGVPMIMEMEQGLVPTVCALWKVPDLVPTLAIHSPVLSKIQGGAPLYLPGVELPAGGIGFPLFQRGTIIAACTTDNSAAGVIGRSTMSSADMLLRAAGICMDTLHVVGDLLCKDAKFSKIERPKAPPPVYDITANVAQLSIQKPREEWPSLGKQERNPTQSPTNTPTPTPAPVPNEPRLIADNKDANDEDTTTGEDSKVTDDSEEIPTEMEALLRWCLLSFLKLEGKNIELPLRSSLLYRNHLIPLCPSDRTLDVKKSSYKKMSKFLDAMQQEGFIEVREIDKGVDAVVAIHTAHPAVRSHVVSSEMRARVAAAPPAGAGAAPTDSPADYTPPVVREMYCITAHVQHIFAPNKKGTALSPAQVRTAVSEYVRAHSLTSPHSKGAVLLDAALASIAGKNENEVIRWDELIPMVVGAMTASTEMQFADGTTRLTKTRLEPVHMQVANRSGNKKVTLVSNLESFGFSLAGLAHACQVGVAASCGVTRLPGAKADQLMLQGDQTHFVAKLLIEKYGLPKKFVEGADKALNKKK